MVKIIKNKPEFKKLFSERTKKLLGEETEKFLKYSVKPLRKFIRINTLKISIEDLKKRLKEKGWKISQPFKTIPEAFVVENKLKPGELGSCKEHQLGYYYIQEFSSMIPPTLLELKENDVVFDCCAAPGSKTTEISALLKNTGLIIANEPNLRRIKMLQTNLQRCGVCNTIITRNNAISLSPRFFKKGIYFDKILVDAPCSGEGAIRKNPKTIKMWNINMIKKFSNVQKALLNNAFKILKCGGVLIYSTCTLTPEENEEVVNNLLEKFSDAKLEKINLEIKTRPGITDWKNKTFSEEIKKCVRIYPQDNDLEGFFIAKIIKK